MFAEVVSFSPQVFMAWGVTAGGESKRGCDLVSMSLKQERFRLIEPTLSGIGVSRIDQVGGCAEVASGMVLVKSLLAIKKMKAG